MKHLGHPDGGLLIQYLDGELSEEQFIELRGHLIACAECKKKQEEFAVLSRNVQKLVAYQALQDSQYTRARLAKAVAGEPLANGTTSAGALSSGKVMRRFAWGMTIAAAFAFVVLLAPRMRRIDQPGPFPVTSMEAATIDVNGENFIPLPFSNPDLPLNAPRIVEMRVPASLLAEAGIVFEPTSNAPGDHTVLANVLLGLDGQPMGVHVLSTD